MCRTVITEAYGKTGQKPNKDQAHIVKTKHNHHICIQFQVAGTGSCYPITLNDRSEEKEGASCTSTEKIERQVPEKVREVIPAKK
ncbi:hypothetical protein HGRIS_006010 [Hohenbuehelia grisea]|uniref:Uncharacterized protein n=1 Tax=Hohenbuehelia grisea TaxID=104357 RepID=A0ABR3K113_9AGAR